MAYETILYAVESGVATITLNRPHALNAFTDQMIGETTAAIKQAKDDPVVRCIVLTGAGRGFSSGQDLKDTQAREPGTSIGDHLRHTYHVLIETMLTTPKPIIGAINGVAAGAGCGIALCTDLRIASDKASFMLAFSKIGLVPDSGTNWILPRLIGHARAYQMAVTAEKVPAETALAWGMVNDVVPHAQFDEAVATWARKIASGATYAYGLAKEAMNRSWETSLRDGLELEAQLQEKAAESHDFAEGVAAFIEKRPADFRGK